MAGAVAVGALDVVVVAGLLSGAADVPDGVSLDEGDDELLSKDDEDGGSTVVVSV